ncbi:hypothetical protein Fot_42918 [Forsythia ovata]|uniref:Uncharacterized protein n=1 Tax=Forsythia ovata TaxID=205694 RepID=A0ABD1RN26_9LAMI
MDYNAGGGEGICVHFQVVDSGHDNFSGGCNRGGFGCGIVQGFVGIVILMEEVHPTVAVPFSLGNLICDNPSVGSCMDVTRLPLMADTVSVYMDFETQSLANSIDGENDVCSFGDSGSEVSSFRKF